MRLILKGVRSFVTQASVELRPLTLLVGENSAGKTTLLAMTEAVLNGRYMSRRPVFNQAPYSLGSFDDIASFIGGPGGHETRFHVGFENDKNKERVLATFEGDEGQPVLVKVECEYQGTSLTASFTSKTVRVHGTIAYGQAGGTEAVGGRTSPVPPRDIDIEIESPAEAPGQEGPWNWRFALFDAVFTPAMKELGGKQAAAQTRVMETLMALPIFAFASTRQVARSISPVRTRPKRVYDSPQDHPDPEGDYIPYVIARALSSTGQSAAALRHALERFGHESGLFVGVKARRLGKKRIWPFQIEIDNSGPKKNLIDVGYGVSQALPIIVESVMPGPSTLLIQQPEVHLHPRAQAALGTFFAEVTAQKQRRFVVETHSDYLIDRVRLAVAQKTIDPNDVLIVFLERKKTRTAVYEIRIDSSGNVIGAPPAYRAFMLREQFRMITEA
jgi:hypothetical protein